MPRLALLLATSMVACVAQAQSAPPAPPAGDSWSQPAPASSTAYRDAPRPQASAAPRSHFKFKDRAGYPPPPANAAQQHSGNAPVGNMGGMDSSGRPAVNCPQTPMDPACH